MSAQHQRLGVLRVELRHHAVPQQTGGEQVTDQVSAIVTELWLIVALGTDIRETDTVQQVRDENGSSIGGPFRITRKEIRAMHLALLLEDVR